MNPPSVQRRLDVTDIDLMATLKPFAFFASDPTVRLQPGLFERATRTPQGAAAVRIVWSNGRADAELYGPGASFLADRLPALVGLNDDRTEFRSQAHPLVDRLARQFSGLRIAASHTLWHDAAWLVPGQRVATADAARQWARLVRAFGEPAPGTENLLLPPDSELVRGLSYYDLHRCGIERRRAQTLIEGARRLPGLASMSDDPAALRSRVEEIRGYGPWMSTNIATMTCGDRDGVVLRDYGLPSYVSWALARERQGDDGRMLELLEPFRPNRWRVVRLIMLAGITPPRHGPRQRNPHIERL